jgi:hypothetical protein
MPQGLAYVPGKTEADARANHRRHCYPGAPVDAWPLLTTRWTSRDMLSEELVKRALAAELLGKEEA